MTTVNQTLVVKKVATPVNKVRVTAVRHISVRGEDAYQLELRQDFVREISNPQGLIGLTMLGNAAFQTSSTVQRVCWQNFSAQQYSQLGIGVTKEQCLAAPMQKVILEQPVELRMIVNSQPLEFQIVEQDSLTPRSWVNRTTGQLMTQAPKRAGQGGEVLTHDGQPIYSNRQLAVKGGGINISFEDTILKHNNQIVGSTRIAQQGMGANAAASSMHALSEEESSIGNPTLVVS